MKQYRIVEKYNKNGCAKYFYPEMKRWFGWVNIKASESLIFDNYYETYEEAHEFLLSRIPKVLFHCVEHPFTKKQRVYSINL